MIETGLTFDDVLLVPGYGNVSRDDGSVETNLGPYKFSIPLISANMDTITGSEMAAEMGRLGGLGILHRFLSIEDNIKLYTVAGEEGLVGVSVGVIEAELVRAARLYEAGARLFCVDVAHAHTKQTGRMLKFLRQEYRDLYIVAGNVATYAGADYLISVGADAVKVGVGAGSVCTTREVTGFGVPQLSAIMDCSRVNGSVIADGGLRKSGDVVKALAAGASMVMLGGMLAGTNEACGKSNGRGLKQYRGMASLEAREAFFKKNSEWRAHEGVSTLVPSKGPVNNVVHHIVEGIKSGLSYAGAKDLDELRRKARFIEVTKAAQVEGTPHAF